jgi:RNA polymerase sigma-70 factor (ECF subfamily)
LTDRPATGLPGLLRRRVRFRFAVTIEAFADVVVAVLRAEPDGAGTDEERAAGLSLEDLYLAASCAAGDERAWDEWLRSYRAFMVGFAARIVSHTEAQDLVDGVIADLWQRRKLARYKGRSSLRTWLGAVVAHAAISVRRGAGERLRSEDPVPEAPAPGRDVDPGVTSEAGRLLETVLSDAIGLLEVDDRLLLLMYYEQGLTLDAIARVFGGSKSTLSRRLAHARDAIRTTAASLARSRYGEELAALRGGVDAGQFEFDLRRACAPQRDTGRAAASKQLEKDSPR